MAKPRQNHSTLTKYFGIGSLMLFSFLQGLINIYVGGTEEALTNIYHFRAPAFTLLSSSLFLGNGIGCILGGTLVDRYGAGTISSVCGIIATIGVVLFSLSHQFHAFVGSEFIIGLGVSVWYPAGIEALKVHFKPKDLPFLAGIFLFFNSLGSAAISTVVYTTKTYGLIDTNYLMIGLCAITTLYLFRTAALNNPGKKIVMKNSLIQDYKCQLRLMKNWLVIPVIISQTIPTVFSYVFLPLWAIPYLTMLLSATEATIIVSSCLIIYGIAGMLLGKLYFQFFSPLAWMTLQYAGSFICFALLLYLPKEALNFWVISGCLFGVSMLLGANNTYLATYLANLFESKYTGAISAVYGYIFMFLISAVTPLFGIALASTNDATSYTIANYNFALQFLLLAFAVSTVIALVLQRVAKNYPKVIKID